MPKRGLVAGAADLGKIGKEQSRQRFFGRGSKEKITNICTNGRVG